MLLWSFNVLNSKSANDQNHSLTPKWEPASNKIEQKDLKTKRKKSIFMSAKPKEAAYTSRIKWREPKAFWKDCIQYLSFDAFVSDFILQIVYTYVRRLLPLTSEHTRW